MHRKRKPRLQSEEVYLQRLLMKLEKGEQRPNNNAQTHHKITRSCRQQQQAPGRPYKEINHILEGLVGEEIVIMQEKDMHEENICL